MCEFWNLQIPQQFYSGAKGSRFLMSHWYSFQDGRQKKSESDCNGGVVEAVAAAAVGATGLESPARGKGRQH